jgi:hypothetical protein
MRTDRCDHEQLRSRELTTARRNRPSSRHRIRYALKSERGKAEEDCEEPSSSGDLAGESGNDAAANRVQHELRRAMHVEFLEDVSSVGVDR